LTIKQLNIMNNFKVNYDKILQVVKQNTKNINFIVQKRKPKLSDIELVAIDFTAQYMELIANVSFSEL
jgi:hypothetical protein